MRTRHSILLLVAALMMLIAGLALAQDGGDGEPPLPDNLCYEGEL